MKLTNFIFFKDTPLIDFQNTILFKSNKERDDFFLKGNHYSSIEFRDTPFNFIRDRLVVNLPIEYELMQGVNYCTFISDFEPDVRFYAYVINYEYLNDKVTGVHLLIDGIMTYCQGNVINDFRNLSVERKTMGLSEYNERIEELKNNSDVIKTFTKKYSNTRSYVFDKFDVLIQCSADLTAEFGSVNNPKIRTSEGVKFDKISSPLNLYVVEQDRFRTFMKALSPYPWISQNIRSVSLIPSVFLEGRKTHVDMEISTFTHLYTLTNNSTTNKSPFYNALFTISKTNDELLDMFYLDKIQDRHLLRSEYTTSEVYTWDGQQLFIDNGQLQESKGLLFGAVFVTGFHNEVGIYVQGYKAKEGNPDKSGSFLNDAIYFRNFDDVPILIDNYNLALSKSANQRQLAESKLVTNRIGSLTDNSQSVQDRFYNATSLLTNISPVNLFGKFNDEYEFYRQQQAEHADLALETPTITNQSNNNSLTIAENMFGLHVKHAQPSGNEWRKIKRYYKSFGFMVNDENSTVDVHSNTIADYVKFSGSILIPNVDNAIVEMIKAQFENGVRFWHNNNTKNPMTQNILNNRMK